MRREALARRQRLDAERAYAAGATEPAYRLLKLALAAEPDQRRALSEMSLVALWAGYPVEAARASHSLILADIGDKATAKAYFNLALACAAGSGSLRDADGQYCGGIDPIYYYLKSWQKDPTADRLVAIERWVGIGESGRQQLYVYPHYRCDGSIYAIETGGNPSDTETRQYASRVYIVHSKGARIDSVSEVVKDGDPFGR